MLKQLFIVWEWLAGKMQTISRAVRPCRVSLFVVVLGAWVIVGVVQSGEGLAALCDRFGTPEFAIFALGNLWWGGTSWYLARAMLRFAFPGAKAIPPHDRWLHRRVARWLPRALGVAPLLAVSIGFWRCPADPRLARASSLLMAALAALFGLFLYVRRPLLCKLKERMAPGAGRLLASSWQDLDQLYDATLTEIRQLPIITRWLLVGHVLISFSFFLLYAAVPVVAAQALGAPTVLVLSLSAWIACGSIVTYASSWLRAPISLYLLALALLLSRFVDNHQATPRTSSPPAARQPIGGLRGDFAQWRTLNGLDEQEPFIVVAAEGGGIRAAYWTAAILGGLQDLQPTFAAHLYAVSSVSGGSLGAATFSALLASDENSRYQQRAKQILRHDFLAPPLARMLYTDLVQRFLPFGVSALDRGAALERAWTEAFAEQNLLSFARPFDSFWAAPHAALPRLFLNST